MNEYKKKLLEFIKQLNETQKWALAQLSFLPEKKITPPTPVKKKPDIGLFEDIPGEVGKLTPAPLKENEGASDIGKRPNLASKYVLLYFNALFHLFLNRGQRYFCVPLVIARLVPILKESESLCLLIWSNFDPAEQWFTYIYHIGNQLFDAGLMERYRDSRGLLWYRWSDKFLNNWLEQGATLSAFFRVCKRMGVKDSNGIVGVEGLIPAPAHEFLRMF